MSAVGAIVPSRMLPSACKAMSLIATLVAPASAVLKASSTEPSVFSRTKLARVTPLSEVNVPPTRTLPSGCGLSEST